MIKLLLSFLIVLYGLRVWAESAPASATPEVALMGSSASAGAVAVAATTSTSESNITPTVVKETAASLQSKKESDIAVNLAEESKNATTSNPWMRMTFATAILGVFAALSFIGLRRWSNRKQSQNKATQIKVLTQFSLGPKKSLAIIQVAGESILVGITDANINHIKTLSLLDEELPEDLPKSFDSLVKPDSNFAMNEMEDDFAISEIKNVVSQKIKKLRPLQ